MPTDSGKRGRDRSLYSAPVKSSLHMSVGSDKSLSKEPGTQQSNAASTNCHLCGAKFKVWYELINHFAAHIRAEKGQDQKRESKVTGSQYRFLAVLRER